MQRVVKISVHISALALALPLCACGDDPEETPDITEAIPLDPEGADAKNDTSQSAEAASGENAELNSGPPPLPVASDTGEGNQGRTIPDTMETGANPPGMTPPPGSKVQRVN